MCKLVTYFGLDFEEAEKLLRSGATATITPGIDSSLFDQKRLSPVMAEPYSTVLTITVRHGGEIVFSSVFALDLLRKPGKRWSPVQEASRALSCFLNPKPEDGDYPHGCGWVEPLLVAFHGDEARSAYAELSDTWKDVASAGAPNWCDRFEAANKALASLRNGVRFASVRPQFSLCQFKTLLARPPEDYQIGFYHPFRHEQYDYRGCLEFGTGVLRIASLPSASAREFLEWRPHMWGFGNPEPEELSRAFDGYFRAQIRKAGLSMKDQMTKVYFAAWSRRAWQALVGKDTGYRAGDVEVEGEEGGVEIVLGRGAGSGLATSRVLLTRSLIKSAHSVNERVFVAAARLERKEGDQPTPIKVTLACASQGAAEQVLAQLCGKAKCRIARNNKVKAISVHWGNPPYEEIHAGYSSSDRENLISSFKRTSQCADPCVDDSRSCLRISDIDRMYA